ncbi:MAG: sigma 54-interacting transcriptional regulator [Desulfobaccales bacterium]
MRPKSLKSKLLAMVSALVIFSGLIIAILVTRQYSAALHQAMMGQAGNMAHAVALDAAEKILTNDLVGLQRMLEQQTASNPLVGYLFVIRDGQVLAHTFERGMPADLLPANAPISTDRAHFKEIVSIQGQHFLDTAWSIFEGKAGVLRLGFSEETYRRQIKGLLLEIGFITLGILIVSLVGSLLFVRRITSPLAALVRATQEIDRGETDVQVAVQGHDEIAALATSFNQMVARQSQYTHRLEEQALELERAHGQTRAACQIVREIGALRTLDEMREILLGKLRGIIPCQHLVLVTLNATSDHLFVLSEQGTRVLQDPELLLQAREDLQGLQKVTYSSRHPFKPPVVPENFLASPRQVLIPITAAQVRGAAVIACSGDCHCSPEEIDWVRLILNQNAGALKRAMEHEEEVRGLKSRIDSAAGFGELIGKDSQMQVVYKLIEDVAPADATVLIQGESGTGKELVARAMHRLSHRQNGPFVVINCSAYPATLLESELFGHEKGAFTGALRQKIGRFEQANRGTVFLDEVGEIPLPAQIKLLRVLQTRKFERVGGEQTLTVDVRILAATHKDLLAEVKSGNFREDLFYRLNVIPIMLPPLRQRKNDIPLLALHFLQRFAVERHKDIPEFSTEAMRLLLDYQWPGNVRELENTVEHAVVLAKGGQVEVWDLPSALRLTASEPPGATMGERELKVLLEILDGCGWNKKLAAQRLGVSRSTIYAMLRKHNIPISGPTRH